MATSCGNGARQRLWVWNRRCGHPVARGRKRPTGKPDLTAFFFSRFVLLGAILLRDRLDKAVYRNILSPAEFWRQKLDERSIAVDKMIRIKCQISRSAFSDERVFRITLADGSEHAGAASRIYFYNSDGTPLSTLEPARARPIDGAVSARCIKETQGKVLVSLPDGEVVEVKSKQVSQETPGNVLVES
jgi:hypothetical protein